ncbi:hypothetical protein GPLA_0327 [Paraglaciecola polaris LMG 21857]|uniref:Uncharacterized protein n=1 Tax=Paraglaciecola polaris LMG 21857 TaxID=1129793 RepID=K6Z4V7_9ALTE|nr:hypothetical protein GPLA_0327 [Paraglaciecola polaris LMG 21857]
MEGDTGPILFARMLSQFGPGRRKPSHYPCAFIALDNMGN